VPDRPIREVYLERLIASMSLPDAERMAAAEEIAAHVDEATADMVGRGLPADVAERRALQHLGPPERLADDLTAARRQGSHALAAVGTALRVSIVTGLQSLFLAWAVIFVVAIIASLAVAGVSRLLGTAILQADWTPVTASLFPAVAACAVAYGIGRTILAPVAVAARRPAVQVRLPLAVAGGILAAWTALTVVAAPYHLAGALLITSAPAWFLLGLDRHRTRTAPVLSSRALIFTLAVFAISAGLVFAAGGSRSAFTSMESEAWDPNVEYARIGPFVDLEHPPLGFIVHDASTVQPAPGPGPVHVERSAVAPPGFLDAWRDVRLEIWPGTPGLPSGPVLDPEATEPLATGAMTFDGRRLTGAVEFVPRPDREHYYVATTGIDPDGVRMQLAWPDLEWWRWEGSVVDFVRASLQR
jgi:uncharacterized membrane protein